jgi:hypothetical protein
MGLPKAVSSLAFAHNSSGTRRHWLSLGCHGFRCTYTRSATLKMWQETIGPDDHEDICSELF